MCRSCVARDVSAACGVCISGVLADELADEHDGADMFSHGVAAVLAS